MFDRATLQRTSSPPGVDQIESSAMISVRQDAVPAKIAITLNEASLSSSRDERDFRPTRTLRHRIRATASATSTSADVKLRVRIDLPLSGIGPVAGGWPVQLCQNRRARTRQQP